MSACRLKKLGRKYEKNWVRMQSNVRSKSLPKEWIPVTPSITSKNTILTPNRKTHPIFWNRFSKLCYVFLRKMSNFVWVIFFRTGRIFGWNYAGSTAYGTYMSQDRNLIFSGRPICKKALHPFCVFFGCWSRFPIGGAAPEFWGPILRCVGLRAA